MEALVEYNYDAQEPDELTIRKGDVIKDIKVATEGWWEGTLRDKRGMFPDNFVKVLDTQGGNRNSGGSKHEEVTLRNGSGRKYCKVLFSYEPCNDDELMLVPDESIEYLGEVEEGWWRGRIKGRTGVFPSNFVSSPAPEEAERNKEKKEYCRVLFPYEAANEDELTLVEGDIVTLLSKDAPDKGWWKGELRGQVGLFPDNFVEVFTLLNNQMPDLTQTKPTTKQTEPAKKKEMAYIRKSLDARNIRSETTLKKINNINISASSTLGSTTTEKKPSNALISSLKRLVGDSGTSSNNGNGSVTTGLGEEFDEVERGEGAPLSHLTASRAKAPRRRLPSTQHLRHHNVYAPEPTAANNSLSILTEDNMTNGSAEILEPPVKDDESDGLVAKTRKKAPWVEELKLNQMERRKMGTEKVDVKKERAFSWLPSTPTTTTTAAATTTTTTTTTNEVAQKPEVDGEEPKSKEKDKPNRSESSPEQPASSPVSSSPAYVPYHLYSQLLDRIAALEEKQTMLQMKVNQLSDQLAPFKAAADKD